MRIIECYIDKFGVICNKRFTFTPNLNCILENNGTGKTTLCAFIKAMLYGIGESRKTSLDDNDRKRYLPWSGGAARGSLTFSVGERVYRAERSFGAKPAEDTFTLYDLKSGLVSYDYTEQLGCELFGIDADGYEETVYLSERGLSPSGENKSVSAKLSDLVGTDGDIGVMDSAMKILDNQRKFLQKKGGHGAISDTKAELMRKCDEISDLTAHESSLAKKESRLLEITAELEAIRSERETLMKMQAESARRELCRGFEERSRTLISEIEKEVAEKDEIIAALGGEIPERSYVDTLRLDFAEAQKLLSEAERGNAAEELKELSVLFASDTAETDMSDLSDALADSKVQKRASESPEYAELSRLFTKRLPRKEECDEAISLLTAPPRRTRSLTLISIILAIITVPAVLLGILLSPIFFAVSGVSATLAILVLIVGLIKQRKSSDETAKRALVLISSTTERKIPKDELLSELIRAVALIERLGDAGQPCCDAQDRLRDLLYKYGASEGELHEAASALIRKHERYKLLMLGEGIRLERAESDRRRAEELIAKVEGAFLKMGVEFSGSFTEIYSLIDRYRELSASITSKREEYARYKTEVGLDDAAKSSAPGSEEIAERAFKLDARAKELNAEYGVTNLGALELRRLLSERDTLISEREAISEKLSGYEENLEVINKTRELLTSARDTIQSKYLGKTERAFTEYMERISGVLGEEYRLDTGFNVTKSEGGISRPSMAYSRGTRELYNLSARLSLIDSLYEGERPFIILDDPFAYFDDERLSGARSVIRALSEERQIIYLTCMKSRCI